MSKLLATTVLLSIIAFPVCAGWLSPQPPELMINQAVPVYSGAVTEIPVDFSERSTYRLSIALDPKVDFHSPEGKKIRWDEGFGFKITIQSSGQDYFTYSTIETLNHSLGYGIGQPRVPTDIPYGDHTLRVEFTEVGEEFNNIYDSVRITVSKLPYFRILD
ncbi:MAG: hypothetical protein IID59_01350 [Proteobacteria bacterium]|nr:hypothetical protein [Pseudomonadota bacterium]